MDAIQTSLYLLAVALCVFSTGLTTRAVPGKPLTFFTGFLLIQSVAFALELLIAHPSTPLKALWLALLMWSSLLLAPCLWLAFQESIGGMRPALRDVSRVHWLPIAAGALLVLPLASSVHEGATFANPSNPPGWLYLKVIHATMSLCVGVFVVQVPWYLFRCRRILLEKLAGRSRHWARWPLAMVATTWGLAILRTADCAFLKWPPLFSAFVAIVSVGVTIGALYLLLGQFGTDPGASEGARAYAKSPLGARVRERIRCKLEATLARDSIYKRNDLTLGALSEALNESPHYVSQVISQDLNTSFHELISGHRVLEAQRLLRAAPDETVLSIAMSVGFNSKSAFNTAFRRVTGMTPSEYRGR
jgi:AraC-like DNA-binding protein